MSNIVNKVDLAKDISDALDLSQISVKKVIDTFFDLVKDKLIEGSQVSIASFGNFVVKNRAARTGRNPKTGETINVAAIRAVTFKPSTLLKQALRNDESKNV